MKFLKWILALLALVAFGGASFMLFQQFLVFNNMTTVANTAIQNSTAPKFDNPFQTVATIAGIAAAGGLLLGLALGIPRRLAGSIRKEALEGAAAQREAAIAARATDHPAN